MNKATKVKIVSALPLRSYCHKYALAMSSEDTTTEWATAVPYGPLNPGDVDVWRVCLRQPEPAIRSLNKLLSYDESVRVARFHFQRDRHNFVVARGALRQILGNYLGLKPDKLVLAYGSKGKPRLTSMQNRDHIEFNLSHSGELALIAVSRELEVGIDIERTRQDFATDEIALQFFLPRELSGFGKIADDKRVEFFFKCWTRKEACMKAGGQGLSIPLDSFDVSIGPSKSAQLPRVIDTYHHLTGHWDLFELHPGLEYTAALAVRHGANRPRSWQWTLPLQALESTRVGRN